MPISKVTRNFQTTIPREIRAILEIKVGDSLQFSQEGSQAVIRKVDTKTLGKSFGIWKAAQEKAPWIRLLGKEEKKPNEKAAD